MLTSMLLRVTVLLSFHPLYSRTEHVKYTTWFCYIHLAWKHSVVTTYGEHQCSINMYNNRDYRCDAILQFVKLLWNFYFVFWLVVWRTAPNSDSVDLRGGDLFQNSTRVPLVGSICRVLAIIVKVWWHWQCPQQDLWAELLLMVEAPEADLSNV